ncbi:MAG: rhamnulokinase [Verrucomicrobiales bacterium]
MGSARLIMERHYLACDLGAESGRVMLGTLGDEKLHLEEIHRFPNVVQRSGESLRWNIHELFGEVKAGLRKVASRKISIESISADSWGVDYVLLDDAGKIMEPVFHYRDPRTATGVEKAHAKVRWEEIFSETGIQFMPINTLYQLASERPERLAQANKLLSIADCFNYLLSGKAAVETSNASTFQLYNPQERTWAKRLIQKLEFPETLFPEIVKPGTVLGSLLPMVTEETGLPNIQVIASCSHDTGAAVVGVPVQSHHQKWAYLSSGTWSLMGVEIHKPIINDSSRSLNFTNEIGFNQTVRLLKNIIGLWLVQECRRAWNEGGADLDYGQLTRLAQEAEPWRSLINPASPPFLAPGKMPEKIAAFCERTGQPIPASPGQITRCILESLALLYRSTLRQLETLLGYRIEHLYVVGGGSQNELLNQLTADVIGIPVFAKPVEATAAGNILIQAMTLGHLDNLEHARKIIRNSTEVREHSPKSGEGPIYVFDRFDALLKIQ